VLDFILSPAYAQAQQGAAPNPVMQFLPLVVLGVLFYFLLIRPQMKRTKEHREMIGKLAKGDEVVTSGGLAGRVVDMGEHYLSLEVADNVTVKVQRSAVSTVLPKGSLKSQ
jgi:preprotein translocase subunit YajC